MNPVAINGNFTLGSDTYNGSTNISIKSLMGPQDLFFSGGYDYEYFLTNRNGTTS